MAAGGLRPGVRLGTSPAARTVQVSQAQMDREQAGRSRMYGAARAMGAPLHETPEPQHAPVTAYSQLPKSDQRRIANHARTLGLTPGVVRANLHDLLDKAQGRASALEEHDPGSMRAGIRVGSSPGTTSSVTPPAPIGRDWYLTEHRRIRDAAQSVGVPHSHMTAATAALSPTVPWESGGKHVNLNLATKTAQLVKDNPQITITREHAQHLHDDQMNNPDSYAGRNPVNWHSLVGTHHVNDLPSHVVATLGSFSGRGGTTKVKRAGGTVEKPDKTFRGAGLEPIAPLAHLAQARNRQNATKALDILRGRTTAGEALSPLGSPKPRTFNDNLGAPYASPGRATIDRWAIRGASGTTSENDEGVVNRMKVRKGTKKEAREGLPQASDEAQEHGTYLYLQHHMAHVARSRGLHAQEAQAIAWMQIKGEHEGFSQFGGALPHEHDYANQQEAARPRSADPQVVAGGNGARRLPGDDIGDDVRERQERAASAIGRNARRKEFRTGADERTARLREHETRVFGKPIKDFPGSG